MSAVLDVHVPIAAVEHWAYCPRQCALIHVEGGWADNVHTALGHVAHAVVDAAGVRHQPGRRLHHRVPVRSDRHGFHGICDAVEVRDDGGVEPIEHKSGGVVSEPAILQVTLQAMALEEMLSRAVAVGWVWTRATRRRHRVDVGDDPVRGTALAAVRAVRRQIVLGELPAPVNDARCDRCSLIDICLPRMP